MTTRSERYLEGQIADLAYPATLPTAMRRVLAVKLHEIDVTYQDAMQALRSSDGRARYRLVAQSDLAPEIAAKIAALREHRRMVTELSAALKPYTNPVDNEVWVEMTEAEQNAEAAKHQQRSKAIEAERNRARDELARLVHDIAAAHIERVKAKVPKPLRDRLDAIGPPALAAGDQPVIEGEVVG